MVLYELYIRGSNNGIIGGKFSVPFWGDYKVSIIGLSVNNDSSKDVGYAYDLQSIIIKSNALTTNELTTITTDLDDTLLNPQYRVRNFYQMIIPRIVYRGGGSTTFGNEHYKPKVYTVNNLNGEIDIDLRDPYGYNTVILACNVEWGIIFNFEKI
jgi:hypothetical protein